MHAHAAEIKDFLGQDEFHCLPVHDVCYSR